MVVNEYHMSIEWFTDWSVISWSQGLAALQDVILISYPFHIHSTTTYSININNINIIFYILYITITKIYGHISIKYYSKVL